MMGSESQVWRSLNVNLIILGWLERKKDVQWCDGKLGVWRQLLGVNARFHGKRAIRGAYRWSGVRYQAPCLSLDAPESDIGTRTWMSAVLGGDPEKHK